MTIFDSLSYSNFDDVDGSIQDVIKDADVFIGVSKGDILTQEDIKKNEETLVILDKTPFIPNLPLFKLPLIAISVPFIIDCSLQ